MFRITLLIAVITPTAIVSTYAGFEEGTMNATKVTADLPLQITFRNVNAPPDAELWIRSEAAKLATFYPRIMGCRVAVENPQHHREGNPYQVRIDLTVPGGELVIKHEPSLKSNVHQSGESAVKKHHETRSPHKNLRQAVNDSFEAACRRLQDYARHQRGDVKRRTSQPVAKITQFFSAKGYGFLLTPVGQEIYFHKNSVLDHAFSRLKIGTTVNFAEEQGEKGLQASSVRVQRNKVVAGNQQRKTR
jgi:cold shock CspA family protein